jgi:hypothetical protein
MVTGQSNTKASDLAREKLIAALETSYIVMGQAGANADVNHPQRSAWEQARAALVLVGALK